MKGTLYLRLEHPIPEKIAWRSSEGTSGEGTLAEVATAANGQRIVVFIPSVDVLLLDAMVPTRKRDRLLQAVPYVLEEHLAGDVETLHFALGNPSSALGDPTLNSIPVMVVARTRMDDWLATLGKAGIAPHALIPDVLALPLLPGTWTLFRESHTTLLRTGPQTGCAPDPEWLSMVLEQVGTEPPSILRVASDSLFPPLPPLPFTIEELPCPNGVLALLIEGYRPNETINLLQGPYGRHEHFDRLWRPWRAATILLLVLMGLRFTGMVVEKNRLNAEDITLRTRMADLYQQTFPEARKIVNPRVQMEQRLNALHDQPEDGSDSLLGLLARTAPILGSIEAMELRTLRYKDGGMELDLSIKNLQMLDRLKQNLAETGMEVEIRSARAQGDNVEGYLVIKGLSNNVPNASK